jgi:heparanase
MKRMASIVIALMFVPTVTFAQTNKDERDLMKGGTAAVSIAPAKMPRIGVVSDRYQSYNIEMVEVTGGNFWKPYGSELEGLMEQEQPAPAKSRGTRAGMNQDLYAYRPPIDLTNARLRKLAAALGPAYVRVSGSWANRTYFADSDQAPAAAPAGFTGVLTHQQWKGVVDFSHKVDAEIVTSFAISVGTRDATGIWTPGQARRFLDYTKAVGGSIAAAEFMNEPTGAATGGAPAGYDAAAYGRDFRVFRAFANLAVPHMLILGPGSSGEMPKTRDILAASGPGVDAVSYHHYGACSKRCASRGMRQTTPDSALSEGWLKSTDETLSFYRKVRDELEPGKPLWLTETAEACCGGNPWASTFLDTFRYLDQLGRLAKQSVQVVAHNTLVASDYGLLDERTLAPKPNYWAALLWRKLMGTTVLESGVAIMEGLHVYAHCLRGESGGVALLVINNDKAAARALSIPTASESYTLASRDLQSRSVQLNGADLKLGENDDLPRLVGIPTPAGVVTIAPATITFLALPLAGNSACQ